MTMQKDALTTEIAHELLWDMTLSRAFEERCIREYTAGRIRGFLHLYIGQEAIAAGAMRALQPDDAVFATYREHVHAILHGVSPESVMAEMYGRQEGCSRGRGGSMHLFSTKNHFFGGNAIVAGAMPLAVGYALAQKRRSDGKITACFFGEGAVAEGVFHEVANLAALWRVPLLMICENNLYAMGTSLERSEAQTNLCIKATAHGVPAISVDGMDVIAVYEAVKKVAADVRTNLVPSFIECKTYRFRAHSMFDPELYRDPTEVANWKKRDPLVAFQTKCRDDNLVSAEELRLMAINVDQVVENAVVFAANGSLEPVKDLAKGTYAAHEAMNGGHHPL